MRERRHGQGRTEKAPGTASAPGVGARRHEGGARRAQTHKLAALTDEIGGLALRCDATEVEPRSNICSRRSTQKLGALDVVHYNPSQRAHGALVDLDPAEVRQALMVSAFGGFLVAQQAARRMLFQGGGAILFTGASCERQGLRAFRLVRDGQVRAPRSRPEHGARARSPEPPCRPFRDRRRGAQRASPGTR